jgi:hypothetical protein
MRTFSEYVQAKETLVTEQEQAIISQVAEGLLNDQISSDSLSNVLLSCQNLSGEELYNELIGGLQGLAGAFGRGVGNVAGAVGRGIGNVAGAVGNAASAVGQGIGNAASAVGQGIGNAAANAGRGVSNAWMRGEQSRKIQQTIRKIGEIKQSMRDMTLHSPKVDRVLDSLVHYLQRGVQNLGQDSSLRFGKGVFQRPQPNAPMFTQAQNVAGVDTQQAQAPDIGTGFFGSQLNPAMA